MIELEIISEVKDNKVKVAIGYMVSDYLPVLQSLASSFAVSFTPPRVGEQVLVLPIRGELNSGVVLRGLYQNAHKALNYDTNTFCIDFEDGTSLTYNTKTSSLEIKALKEITINADKVKINSKNIDLGLDGAGVVTTECICAFTGSAHPHGSNTTRSKL